MFKNLDFQNDRFRSIFWIISAFSWISFISMNAIGLIKLVIRNYKDDLKNVSNNIIWGFLTTFWYFFKISFYSNIMWDMLISFRYIQRFYFQGLEWT